MSAKSKNECSELTCGILQIKEMAKKLDDD